MFDIFKKYRSKKKCKEARELELKKALSDKFAHYDESQFVSEKDSKNTDDHTEVLIDNHMVRVRKEQITLFDVTNTSQTKKASLKPTKNPKGKQDARTHQKKH